MTGVDSAELDAIASELCDPRAAVLVGAGGSAGAGLPTWKEFLTGIASKLPDPFGATVAAFVAAGQYQDAAEVARRATKDPAVWHEHFAPFARTGIATSVWRLVAAMGIPKMVTPNWDNVAQDSFADVWHRSPAAHVGVDEILTPLTDPYPHIVHPHGKVPRWSSLVFTGAEYDAAERDPQYQEFWIDLLLRRPLLIVGFSGEDPAFAKILGFVRSELRIIHKIQPIVICPEGTDVSRFGGHARVLSYQPEPDHRGATELLRNLRDRMSVARRALAQADNPFERAGLPAFFTANSDELIFALVGANLRQHCSAELFTGMAILLGRLHSAGSITVEEMSGLISLRMRLSGVEADQLAEQVFQAARSYGWVSDATPGVKATELTPRPDPMSFTSAIEEVRNNAQRPVSWIRSPRHDTYVRSAILQFLGSEGGRAARSLLGLELGTEVDARALQYSLERSRASVGDGTVERQICAAVIAFVSEPPPAFADTLGRLSNFALVQSLVALSSGRNLLRTLAPVDTVYFDTNIILPAIAPGHRWSARCASLISRCRRHISQVLVLDGFAEELQIQLREAESLAGSAKTSEDLYQLSWTHGRSNGFLDAYANWSELNGLSSFEEYRRSVGLGDPLERLRGLGCRVVSPPRDWGHEAEVHARVIAHFSGSGRNDKLVRHEADQIALLARENKGKRFPGSRFVTAHERLRGFLVRDHFAVAAAVSPPIALAHLLAATSPTDVPPESLRDLAFEGPAVQVAEIVFGMLLTRWKKDTNRLKQLASEDITEEISTHLRRLNDRLVENGSVDARRELLELVEHDVIPRVERRASQPVQSTRSVLDPPRPTEPTSVAAERLAIQLTELRSEPAKGE